MRTDFHCLIAVAFVPVDDVEDAFDTIAAAATPVLQPVIQHMEDVYVRGRLQLRRRGGRVRVRGRPMFPPETWNCHDRVLAGQPRTTNTCEAWHRRLGLIVGKHHPHLFTLLGSLQEEVGEINVQIARAEGGHSPPSRKNKYVAADERIRRLVERYEEYRADDDILGYLRGIGHNVGHMA